MQRTDNSQNRQIVTTQNSNLQAHGYSRITECQSGTVVMATMADDKAGHVLPRKMSAGPHGLGENFVPRTISLY